MIAQHNQKSQRNIPKGSNRVAMKKIGDKTVLSIPLILLVPGAGIEPAQPQGPRDFKSLASTNSATQAYEFTKTRSDSAYIIFALHCQGFDSSNI